MKQTQMPYTKEQQNATMYQDLTPTLRPLLLQQYSGI